jgi:hypothetical protein
MGSYANSSTTSTGEAEHLKKFLEENWSKHGYFPRAVGEGVCEIVLPQHATHFEMFIEDLVAAGASNLVFQVTEEECKLDVYTEDGVAQHLKTGAISRWLGRLFWLLLWVVSVLASTFVMNRVSGKAEGEL